MSPDDCPDCKKVAADTGGISTECLMHLDWHPHSHLGALTDRPVPTSGKIIPGKSRRFPKSQPR